MGEPMVLRLADAGYRVQVYARRPGYASGSPPRARSRWIRSRRLPAMPAW